MSSVTLTAATRQNLLSLQDTANLLSTTQNRLSTGKKVNSALDNPTNFFTAQGLSNRSSDLAGLLDGLSNGVQVIQAANQGITSMQKLLDSAKSTLTQALANKSSTGTGTAASTAKLTSGVALAATADYSDTGVSAFAIKVDGGDSVTITLDKDTLAAAAKDLTAVTREEVLGAINNQLSNNPDTKGLVTAKLDSGGRLSFETKSAIATSAIAITNAASTVDIGFGEDAATEFSATGAAATGTSSVNDTRKSLSTQFNSLLEQITQQAKDSSFNGINLLYRTTDNAADNKLKVSFNEDASSKLEVNGVKFDATGLGLADDTTDLQSDTVINTMLESVKTASDKLRAQSSTFGSNLSVVQTRQDFSKNLINILDTGASNLTSADLNEEAANSNALSTRNSLAISALSLANTAQQGILQLLR